MKVKAVEIPEFEAVVKPLMEWLRKNQHPHVSVILTSENAEMVEGLMCVHNKTEKP